MKKGMTFVLADGNNISVDVATNLNEAINLSCQEPSIKKWFASVGVRMLPNLINLLYSSGALIKKNSLDSDFAMADQRVIPVLGDNNNQAGYVEIVCISDMILTEYNDFLKEEGDSKTHSHLMSTIDCSGVKIKYKNNNDGTLSLVSIGGPSLAWDPSDKEFVACTDMRKLYAIYMDID